MSNSGNFFWVHRVRHCHVVEGEVIHIKGLSCLLLSDSVRPRLVSRDVTCVSRDGTFRETGCKFRVDLQGRGRGWKVGIWVLFS